MFYTITEKYPHESVILMWAYFHHKLVTFLCEQAHIFALTTE